MRIRHSQMVAVDARSFEHSGSCHLRQESTNSVDPME